MPHHLPAPPLGQLPAAPGGAPGGGGEPAAPAMAVDEEAPHLTEEEEAWLAGAAAAPDGATQPDQHKHKAYSRLAKRQRQGQCVALRGAGGSKDRVRTVPVGPG
eukprot:7492856-Pyramimonas_sp.AAC.1